MRGRILRSLPVVSLLLATLPAAALADQPPASPSVTISDSGVSPRGITVGAGGSVIWTNAGNNVHTATSVRGTVLTFDTGGLSHGQAASSTFGVPGPTATLRPPTAAATVHRASTAAPTP